jgi:hypothetical protein
MSSRTVDRAPGPHLPLAVALFAIAVLSAVPMVFHGAAARIEYDGWLHIFMARDDDWSLMWRQILRNAHPPLYFLLLKAVSLLGADHLVYRSLGILSALATVAGMGILARRTSLQPPTALLCGFAFGFATTTVVMANEVRSYMLGAAFLSLAMVPFLTLLRPGGDARSRVLFAGLLTLSFLSHYGILLVAFALLAAPPLLALSFPRYRRAWREALPSRWIADIATLAPVLLVMAAAYKWHIGRHAGSMRHLPQFYYSGSGEEPLWRYAWRSTILEIDLLSPVSFSPLGFTVQALAVGLVVAIPALLLWLLSKEEGPPLAGLFPVALIVLATAHLGGSIVGKYPFGGALRHQFFLFPFCVLTLFLLLDRILARITVGWARRVAWSLAASAVLLAGLVQWRSRPLPRQELFTREVAVFRDSIPAPEAVYVDGFSQIPFFAHYHDWEWRSTGRAADGRLRSLTVTRGGESFVVLAELSRWNPAAGIPVVYADIRAGLEETGASSVAVFHLDQAGVRAEPPTAEQDRETVESILSAAGAAGLTVTLIARDEHDHFALLEIPRSTDATRQPEVREQGAGWARASPNPIQVCDGSGVGVTTLHWNFPGEVIELRIGEGAGKLWITPSPEGSAETGAWVKDGTTFLVRRRGTPPVPGSLLASVVVHHTSEGCPAALRPDSDGRD